MTTRWRGRNKIPTSGNFSRPKQDNGPLFTATGKGDYANLDRECRLTGNRISNAACIAQSCRTPDTCAGCEHEVKS